MSEHWLGQRLRDPRTGKTYIYQGQLGSNVILARDADKPHEPPRKFERDNPNQQLRRDYE